MSAIDLIIFDCDGVLVDTEEASSRAMAGAIALLGWSPSWQEVHRRFTGLMLADIVAGIEDEIGRRVPADWPATFRCMATHAFAAGVDPIDGVTALLASLKVESCVASNGTREKMAITLGAAGLLPLFEERMFSAYDVARGKPAPDLFLHAATTMAVAPEHCLVIEDSAAGLAAALAAGMHVAWYCPGDTPSPPAVHRLRAMSQVPALLDQLARN